MKQFVAIRNARLVLETGILHDGILLIEGDTIVGFGKAGELAVPEGAVAVDAQGMYVGPGFVDIHVHGGNGFTTSFDTKESADFFLQHGTTTLLATPAYSYDFEKMLEAVACIRAAMESAPTVRGIYFEGPYTNPQYGAFADRNPWRGPIKEEQYKPLVDAAGSLAMVWTVAPERDDLLPFLQYARQVNPDVKFAVGHSEATPAQIRALGEYAPILHTHITNATGRQPVPAGTRGCGPDEHCFMTPEAYGEMISDSCGIHVSADMQKLVYSIKGSDRIILITDSTALCNTNPPELSHVEDLNFTPDGLLAGSKLTMEQACRNVMRHTGCTVADAFRMAATNPARALGFDDIGSVAIGKKADLVFLDENFCVQRVMLRGESVEDAPDFER